MTGAKGTGRQTKALARPFLEARSPLKYQPAGFSPLHSHWGSHTQPSVDHAADPTTRASKSTEIL